MYMTTLIFVLISGTKLAASGTLVRHTFGASDLNHGIHTQLDFESNMCRFPPG